MASRMWRMNEPQSGEVTEHDVQLKRKWIKHVGARQRTKRACLERVHIAWLQPHGGLEKEKPWASSFQELRCGRKKGWGLGSLSSWYIGAVTTSGFTFVQMQWVYPDVKCGLQVRVMCLWGFIYDIKWAIALLNAEGGATHARVC